MTTYEGKAIPTKDLFKKIDKLQQYQGELQADVTFLSVLLILVVALCAWLAIVAIPEAKAAESQVLTSSETGLSKKQLRIIKANPEKFVVVSK